jgi:hypothetical protein
MTKDTRQSDRAVDVTVPDWLLRSALSSWHQHAGMDLDDRMKAVLVDALTEYRIAYWPEEG